jgi:hypothetical protein
MVTVTNLSFLGGPAFVEHDPNGRTEIYVERHKNRSRMTLFQ